MKLAEFKLLTLEDRLDYLFEHTIKDDTIVDTMANDWKNRNVCEHGRLFYDYCEPCGRINPI